MIALEKVTKIFGNQKALENIDLTFKRKETVAIIGPSGSGKSTLLRCINNLENPTSGNVLINKTLLTAKNRNKLCFKIGMVFQQFNLFPHMSVLENLIYGPLNVLGQNKTDTVKRANKLLKKFGLLSKVSSLPDALSGGQKQRVAIARALMMDPEIMLFDEPTSALDPEIMKDIISIINELKEHMIMVVITHDVRFAKIIADRIIFMDKGQILADQPVDKFFDKPSSHRARLFLENVADFI